MALYTKYRPSDFDNLVGQNFIKETLKKAIAEDKTVGAYLFCGPRGTGKTSTARLFAKTLNCLGQKNGNPCLECEICKDFADEKLIDIVEIDAASHTGVDNIREIIEKAQFSPTKTKYKVYIIDEVHMLSKGAFNALLKILEEPPKHVKFILATTETHKVPETIISRCQRYDFKRISDKDIKERLEFIAKSENIKIDKKALEYIVSSSAGGMRNAISLFEQMISNSEVKYENIIEKLGITSREELEGFLEKLVKKDKEIIELFENISTSGKNIKLFIKDLIFLTKDKALEKVRTGENISDYINIIETLDKAYVTSKNSFDEETTFLVGILKIIADYTPPLIPTLTGEGNKKENNSNIFESNSKGQKTGKKAPISEEKKNKVLPPERGELEGGDQEISKDDLDDIFGGEKHSNLPLEKEGVKSEEIFNDSESIPNQVEDRATEGQNSFDIQKLLAKLKENKAKGAVIFSLKGAKFDFNSKKLEIKSQTKVVKKTLTNTENNDIIRKTLTDLGFPDIVLNII